MSDDSPAVRRLLSGWSRTLRMIPSPQPRESIVHKIWEDEDFPHEGDCLDSACLECGCCMHCEQDCPCPGCDNNICLCSIGDEK